MKIHTSITMALAFTALAGPSTLLQAKLQNTDIGAYKLNFADLRLGNPQDQQILHQELQRAAPDVCDTLVGSNGATGKLSA